SASGRWKSAGSLINSRLTTPTPNAWTPSLWIVDPNGIVIASMATTTNSGQGEADLLGVAAASSGVDRVVVAGTLTSGFASYRLLSTVQIPFSSGTGTAIQVSTTEIPLSGYVDRYAAVKPNDPVEYSVARLINPAISAERVLSSNAQVLVSGNTIRGEIA